MIQNQKVQLNMNLLIHYQQNYRIIINNDMYQLQVFVLKMNNGINLNYL